MHSKHFLFFLLFSTMIIINGCSSNSDGSDLNSSTISLNEKKYIHSLFLNEYLWYDQVATQLDYQAYSTPQEMINALKISPPDTWSFHITKEAYEDYINQQTAGFGFGYTNDFTIYLVRIGSPAYQSLLRGDKIMKINGETITNTHLQEASQNLGTETTFTLIRNGETIDIAVTPSAYTFQVTEGKILLQGEKRIGYLRYDAFTESSVQEIENSFTLFKQSNIDELVIDLRYNGGGSLSVTSILLDNITNAYPSQRQVYLDWNDLNKYNNTNYYFDDQEMQDGNELTMNRVVFLVTSASASASEAVINALIPYLGAENVITIGDHTHGKPVGMSGRTYESNYYFLINFIVRNDQANTTPFYGIPPTCLASDDMQYLRGDPQESMLATALFYIEHEQCM